MHGSRTSARLRCVRTCTNARARVYKRAWNNACVRACAGLPHRRASVQRAPGALEPTRPIEVCARAVDGSALACAVEQRLHLVAVRLWVRASGRACVCVCGWGRGVRGRVGGWAVPCRWGPCQLADVSSCSVARARGGRYERCRATMRQDVPMQRTLGEALPPSCRLGCPGWPGHCRRGARGAAGVRDQGCMGMISCAELLHEIVLGCAPLLAARVVLGASRLVFFVAAVAICAVATRHSRLCKQVGRTHACTNEGVLLGRTHRPCPGP